MKRLLFITSIVALVLLSGCMERGQHAYVEDLAMVSSIAFDYIDEQTVKMTVSIPHPTGESQEVTQHYSVDTELIQEGFVQISSKADKMVILNQLRTLLFSEEFAREGQVTEVIKHFYRNPKVGNNVQLGIVKGSAEEILKSDFPDKPSTDTYLYELLSPKLHTAFSPFTTMHDFLYTETNPIFYSTVPYLELEKDSVKIESIALFDSGKMIDTIAEKESSYIQALKGVVKLSPLEISFGEQDAKENVHIELIKSKAKITSNKNMESPKVTLQLNLQGALFEYKGKRDLQKMREYKALEKEVSEQVKKEIEQLLAQLQKLEVDPIGISEEFRMYYKGKWTEEITKKIIQNVEYDVQVEFKLLNTGILK